ncbi:hypothetical protein [Alkalimarinus coralli]|uniref:hypothetical protein n=1 Tax=Alkalimarinus coralli TaxID=2935863 RepID=UPI00202B975A|nr:hypothetical protein [Alkalimarinus coralli]
MISQSLAKLSDIATEAHTRIQQTFAHIDPIVGVNQSMRKSGVPADLMTIDCLKSGKRIILVLHDQTPDVISYQFSYKDQDPADTFERIKFAELTSATLYDWMKSYFLPPQS